jgi:hypothetical protein
MALADMDMVLPAKEHLPAWMLRWQLQAQGAISAYRRTAWYLSSHSLDAVQSLWEQG